MKDFLSVADVDAAELTEVLRRAAAVKSDPGSAAGALAGQKVGLFFEKPSARTRLSTEIAAVDLGMTPVVLKADEIGLGTRESVEDVGRVFDRFFDVLALRVLRHGDLVLVANSVDAPVINLLSDLEHPCQALGDLQTIAEQRELAGTVIAFVGDGNNVCHSLMLAGAMAGMEVRVATPSGFEPTGSVIERSRQLAAASEGAIALGNEPLQAVEGAHVVYTDVWASMGQEDQHEQRQAAFAGFQIDEDLFGAAAADAVFLHCLPANRGQEVTDGVLDHARSGVFDQAENRLHSFKALLLHLYGR